MVKDTVNSQLQRYVGEGPKYRRFYPWGAWGLTGVHGSILVPQVWKLPPMEKQDAKERERERGTPFMGRCEGFTA